MSKYTVNQIAKSAGGSVRTLHNITRSGFCCRTMWGRKCSPDAHIGLAQMYEAHPDFNQRYESLAKGFTGYICATIRAHSR